MTPSRQELEQTLAFIREHRSNEANFDQLKAKLDESIGQAPEGSEYYTALTEVREKQIAAYSEAKENGGTSWPEFEKFITEFERSITAVMKDT
jgi:hypothetical protein